MDMIEIDLDPRHLVEWLMAERDPKRPSFTLQATRSYHAKAIGGPGGDTGDEDALYETCASATLEARPLHASDGWVLRVAVESDEVTEPLTEVSDEEKEIGIAEFYDAFIRRESNVPVVVAEAADAAARERLMALLADVERDRHAGWRKKPPQPAR